MEMAWNDVDHSYCRHWSEHFLSNTSQVVPAKECITLNYIQDDRYDIVFTVFLLP